MLCVFQKGQQLPRQGCVSVRGPHHFAYVHIDRSENIDVYQFVYSVDRRPIICLRVPFRSAFLYFQSEVQYQEDRKGGMMLQRQPHTHIQ